MGAKSKIYLYIFSSSIILQLCSLTAAEIKKKKKMDSCFSAKQQSSEEERRTTSAKNPAPYFSISPFSFPTFNFTHNTPFFGQPLRLNPSFPLLVGTSNVVCKVQKSILSNVDKYLKILDELRSRNGVLDKLMSISSHLQKGFQVTFVFVFIFCVENKLKNVGGIV